MPVQILSPTGCQAYFQPAAGNTAEIKYLDKPIGFGKGLFVGKALQPWFSR